MKCCFNQKILDLNDETKNNLFNIKFLQICNFNQIMVNLAMNPFGFPLIIHFLVSSHIMIKGTINNPELAYIGSTALNPKKLLSPGTYTKITIVMISIMIDQKTA